MLDENLGMWKPAADGPGVRGLILLRGTALIQDGLPDFLCTLAHEYAHHFLNYWMGYSWAVRKDSMPSWFYKIRGLSKSLYGRPGEKPWRRTDREVFAEDYAFFFSPHDGEHAMSNSARLPGLEVLQYIVQLPWRTAKSRQLDLRRRRPCGKRDMSYREAIQVHHQVGMLNLKICDANAYGGIQIESEIDAPALELMRIYPIGNKETPDRFVVPTRPAEGPSKHISGGVVVRMVGVDGYKPAPLGPTMVTD